MIRTAVVRADDLDTLIAACTSYFPPDPPPHVSEAFGRMLAAFDVAHAAEAPPPAHVPDGGGQWLSIAFMGHVELTGYVTEITLGGQPAFHVDLPEKLWGGNPMAWEEYAATALYSRRPVTEESVRSAWEAQRERTARRAAQEAEWQARQQRQAIEAGGDDDTDTDEEPAF